MGALIDLTGQKFGRLTVLARAPENDKHNKPQWICQCNCGTQTLVSGKRLREGHTKSCGCLMREKIGNLNRLDLTNQIFGYLKAIEPIKENNTVKWKCQCQLCGNYTLVETNKLTSGHTKTCGCTKISLGEQKIKNLLDEANITYVTEKRFPNFNKYRFDFYVDNTYVIEFDGIQHFEANGGWNTEEKVVLTQQRDIEKNNYCFKNNIPIIRIPYTILDVLKLEDLIPTTSIYLLKHAEEASE